MPLVDSNQADLWDGGPTSLYRALIGDQSFGYARPAKQTYMGNDADLLIAALVSKGLVVGQRIALIGAGFGWVAERLIERGYGPLADGTANGKVCNVETSTWIHSNKSGNSTTNIINADVNAATGRRIIRQEFGSNNAEVHWTVSEDVLPVLIGDGSAPGGNNEIVPFCQSLRALASVGVAHWITTGTRVWNDPTQWAGDPRLNWKTLEDWKAWCSPDWVIQRSGGAVL